MGVEERDFIRRIAGHLFIRIRAAQTSSDSSSSQIWSVILFLSPLVSHNIDVVHRQRGRCWRHSYYMAHQRPDTASGCHPRNEFQHKVWQFQACRLGWNTVRIQGCPKIRSRIHLPPPANSRTMDSCLAASDPDLVSRRYRLYCLLLGYKEGQ